MLKKNLFGNENLQNLILEEERIKQRFNTNPNEVENIKKLAEIYSIKKEYNKAIEMYLKLLDYSIEKNEIYMSLGYIFFEIEEYDKAIDCFLNSLRKDNNEAFVYFLLGNAYSRTGKIIEATTYYELAIFLNLDIYDAHCKFGDRYEKLAIYDKALREYTTAYEIDPRDRKLKEKIEDLKKYLDK